MKCWVSVVSKEHALRGIAGGFMQACHGKAAPLKRMQPGDYFMFYCPAMTMGGSEKVQKFLGFGKVKDRDVYQFEMSPDFHPFRPYTTEQGITTQMMKFLACSPVFRNILPS